MKDGDLHPIGPIVYRLGRHPFTVQRGVRFPLGLFGWPTDNRPVAGEVRWKEGVFDPDFSSWGRSSVWLEHSTVTREVAGSSPVGPVVVREFAASLRIADESSALVVKLVDTPS